MSSHGSYASQRLLNFVVIKEDIGYHWMLQEESKQFDGCGPVVDSIEIRTPGSLAGHSVFPNGSNVHFDPFLMGAVLVSAPLCEANIPDAEFPIIDGLPLALNIKNYG